MRSKRAHTERTWPGGLSGIWLALLLLVTGCDRPSATAPSGTTPGNAEPVADALAKLTVAVIDDGPLAEAIRREVNSRRESPIEVRSLTGAEWRAGAPQLGSSASAGSSVDVVIFPVTSLGDLVASQTLREVPQRWQQDPTLNFADFLPVARQNEIRWGGSAMALPLGSPLWMLYYRADLLEERHLAPPKTWTEYRQLVTEFTARPASLGADRHWVPAAEPLAVGWASRTLLARAAGYVQDRSQYSTLFDIRTFDPLITSPAFQRALDELIEGAGPHAELLTKADPAACEHLILTGQAVLAITYPSAHRPPVTLAGLSTAVGAEGSAPQLSAEQPGNDDDVASRIRIVPLPGALESWESRTQAWRSRNTDQEPLVPLIGFEGRLAGVVRTTRNPVGAWSLVASLCQPELLLATAPYSAATLPVRQSLLEKTRSWMTPTLPSQVIPDVVQVIERTQRMPAKLMVPPVPGLPRYLGALDKGVQQAVRGELSSQAALQAVARAWQAITDELGREKQVAAYQGALGIEF